MTQVEQPISPAAESVIGPVAETATVPEASGSVIVWAAVGSATAIVVLLESMVAPSKTSGEAPVMLPPMRLMFPVATVKPFEAVSSPDEVTVPVPMVEMLLEVEMLFVVAIAPKPVAMEPEARAPTEVKDDTTTPEFNVVPVSVLASAVTVMFAVPLNETPLIVRAFSKDVAVPAFPVTEVWSPVLLPEDVPEPDGAPTMAAVIPPTIPVKVGELSGAKAVLVKALAPNVPPAPMFKTDASVPDKVKILLTVRVFPEAKESPVTVAAFPVVEEDVVALPVKAPTKVVAVNAFVPGLKTSPVPRSTAWFPFPEEETKSG